MNRFEAAFLVLLGALCFSTTGSFQAIAPSGASPWTVAEARLIVGSLSLFTFCYFRNTLPSLTIGLPWRYIFICSLSIVCYQPLFFFSVKTLGVATASVIAIGTTPVWTAVLEALLYKKIPAFSWFVATALAIGGILHINAQEFVVSSWSALCLPCAAGLSYAILLIYSPKAIGKMEAPAIMMLITAIAALALLPVSLFFPINWIFSFKGALVCLGIGTISLGLAFSLFMTGLKQVGPTTAATLGLAEPIGATYIGLFLLHEHISKVGIGGLHLLFASIILLVLVQFFKTR